MNTTRINILGASGSGATTLASAVAARLSIPHFDCDDYYHAPSDPPFQNPRSAEERHRLMIEHLVPVTDWVLSGGIAGWNPYPELDFSLVVLLWIPQSIRMTRLRARELARFGTRVLPGGDMHKAHEEFLQWASRYDAGDVDGKTLAKHEAFMAAQSCPTMEIRGDYPVERNVVAVLRQLEDAS